MMLRVISVLARYGFTEFLRESGMLTVFAWGRNVVGLGPDVDVEPATEGVRLRKVLIELGPTFIKLGQILSTRPDLVGNRLADELAELQSDSPRVPYDLIHKQLLEEFGSEERLAELFQSIDKEPLAAASMAQVHKAVLADGTEVVLKVLRPGVKQQIEKDMDVICMLAEFTESYFAEQGYSPTAVAREFQNQIKKETDLLLEAKSTLRLHELFEDDPNIAFPQVYKDQSTKRVLCLERIDALPLSRMDIDQLDAETRRTIVANGSDAVFRMCLVHGFFHADPHPGNLFVLDDGRLCFIDCGMTGHVEARTAENLADLIKSVIDGHLDRAVRATLALSGADPVLEADRAFRLDAWEYISRFQVNDLSEIDLSQMLADFFELLRKWRIQCPSDLVFLIKAITTIEGVGQRIDPTFDLVGQVRPHIERLVKRRYSPSAARRRLYQSATSYIRMVEDLPNEIRVMFSHFKRKDFTVKLEHTGLDRLTRTIEHASRNLSLALIFASLLLTSSIFFAADSSRDTPSGLSTLGTITLVGSAVFGFIMILAIYRRPK